MHAVLRRSGRPAALAAVLVLAVAGAAGCSAAGGSGSAGASGSAGGSGTAGAEESGGGVVRVLIADGSLRRLGEPCNGAGAFRSVHAQAAYAIENGDGVEVARGELPTGTAEKIMDVDFREGMRQPTMCVMEVDVTGLTSADGHEFVVGNGFAAPIQASEDAELIGEVLIS